MKFGSRLYELREGKFITKVKLSKELNISRHQLARYENDGASPSADHLIRLADFFEVSADYLLGRDDYASLPSRKGQRYIVIPKEITEEDAELVRNFIKTLRTQGRNRH